MTTFKRFLTLSLMTVLTAVTIYSYAVPAYRGWQTKTQPDGSTITVRQMGDEFFHYWENEAGQQVAKDAEGWWRVQAQPATQSAVQKRKQASRRYNQNEPGKPAKVGGINLAPRGLVILVNFTDVTFRAANTQSAMSDLMNSTNYTYDNATGSVREFFKAQSGGAYVPDFDVVGPFNLDYNRAHYGANNASGDDVLPGDVIVEACQKADADGVDFTLYNNDGDTYVDFVYVIYAGEGEADSEVDDALWPMNWTLASARYFNNCSYTQEQSKFDELYINNFAFSGELRGGTTTRCAIGTIAHEFGHVLGLPDYYVTSKSASNYNKKYTPGSWHIMDYGSYNNDGRTPPNYTPHDKYFFGWSTPTLLAKDEKKNCTLTTTYGSAYQITGGTTLKGATASDRVWYIENRQKSGWDEYLPGHGMVAWEVTYNSSNWNSNAPNNSTVGYTVVTANNLTRPYTPYTTNDPSTGNCGTPFPGTSNITSWTPATGCAITNIAESTGNITFKYNGGVVKTKSSYEFVTEHCTAPDDGEVDINDPLSVVITPASGYSLADASCWTVEMGGVALTYGTDFTYNPATNTFYIASLTDDIVIMAEAKAIHTVTWSVNGVTTPVNFVDGATLVLPSTPSDCSGSGGKKFVGWTAQSTVSGSAPADLFTTAGSKTVTSDITYYAVFATASGGGSGTPEKASSITAGDQVVFVCESDKMEMTSIGTYGVGTEYTTNPAGTYAFTVEAGSSEGTFAFKNGTDYISWSSGNSLAKSTTKNASSSWNVAFSSGNANITNAGTPGRKLRWNHSSPRFACYTSDQTAIQLYKITGGTSYSDYSLTCSAPEPCANQVALSKGTPANGSFNISKTGAQDNCAAGGLVVNVTDITPAAGYEFGAITQTGIVSGVTIDQVAKTVTYAKDVTGTSTINVTFNPLPTYAIRFFNNGAQVGATQNLIAGAVAVKPSDPTPCTGDYTFVGWWTAALVEDNTTAETWVTDFTVTGAQDYYAVFSKTEGGGGSSVTYEFSIATSDFSGSSYDSNNGSHSSTAYDVTDNTNTVSVSWTSYNVSNNSGMQWKKSGSYIYNSTDLGKINSVTVSGDALTKYYGTSAEPTNTSLGTNDGYFKVTNTTSGALHTTSITVNFTKSTGGGSTTYYTTAPSCVECTNKVTLTKGAEEHGTFTLDKANGEYNNCTSNFVVTVSGITPASGYYCTGVTATGGYNTVTGPDGSGNYTVTYTKENNITSTITANFAPNPTYSVTWSMNGDESTKDYYEEGESIIFPATADGCDGKTFMGWSAVQVPEQDDAPAYTTSATMGTSNLVYYAVYAEASGSGGTPSSASYSFTDKYWHATGGDWTSGQDGNDYANSGVKVLASGSGANATCPNSYSGVTSIVVSYCTNSSSGAGSITMDVNGTEITRSVTKSGGTTARDLTFDFSATTPTGAPHLTVTCTTNSIYVCGVTINYGGGTTYSGYTTTCGAGISAQNIGWITSAQGKTVKRVINVSAKNFDDATTLTATCANSNFQLTLGESAVPAGTTGLTTTLTVEYTPIAESTVEANVDITLSAGDKTRTITVSGRSVPDDFLLITKKNDKWYALPANMTSGSGEYDGVEVSPNDATTPTAVPVSPSTLLYNLAPVASSRYAENGNLVRLVGNNNKCLWSNKATTTGKENIQNNAALGESNGDNYEWDLRTDDGIHYYVENPHHPHYASGRRLAYGTKFGMYIEETVFFIVRAGCSSQPGEIVVSPRRVDATFSWVSNTTQMHIDLYTNSEMTEGHLSATASSSPYVFTGLAESTDYWYKLTPGDDTDCAVTGTFKTTGPIIDIVEWKEDSVVLFIDKGDINPVIVIDGQEEHGSITGGGEATELFFAKYFEGAGAMKLLSIFNGTKNAISLSGYKFIDRHVGDNASIYGSDNEYDLSSLGSIEAGQEIIFFSRPVESQTKPLFDCSNDFLTTAATKNKTTDNPRWIECATGKFANKAITFNGNDALILKKGSDIIDVIGSLGTPGQDNNCNGEDAWAGTIKNMDYDAEHPNTPSNPAYAKFFEVSSLSPSSTADSLAILNAFGVNLSSPEINISTARCIFFRDKRVTSGDSAVLMNTGGEFKTFTTHIEGGQTYKAEWYGRSVCMTSANKTAAGVTNDAQATCNSYQDIANMDYNQYYIDWSNIDPGQTLDNFTSDPDTKEYTIPIDDMRQYACLKLRFQLKLGDEVLTEAAQQVPIVVVGDVDTNDPLFSELVIDKGTGDPSYSYSVERCKDCDVVVLGAASLTKGLDADPKDVPEVGNVKVYPGGQLIVPSGTEYTIKSLALRRQEDEIATANIQGTLTYKAPAAASPAPRHEAGADDVQRAKKTEPAPKQTYFDLRIDPTNWHYISLPYDVNVADIRFANPEETAIPVLGTDYLLKWYDGEKRAATQAGGCWEMVAPDATLKKGLGYIFSLPGDGKVKREFRFPMSNDVITEDHSNKEVGIVYGYGCDKSMTEVRANHRGWNLIGNPFLMPYSSDITNPLLTGKIVEDHSTDPWDGHFMFEDNPLTNLHYIVEPVDNGWSEYRQVAIADYQMTPFTSYFVQIGGSAPTDPQAIQFKATRVQRSSIVSRRPAEYEDVEDTHPVWCAIDLTNSNAETDETTLLISDDFTDGYDIMNDLVKMRGTYYQYTQITTRPVLASRNNEGEMAFNALPDSSAVAGVPLNFFTAYSGSYTIAYNDKFDRDNEVKAVMLLDKTTNRWYDLMSEPYEFITNREDNTTRFILSVRVERKKPQTPTDLIDPSAGADGQTPRKLLINGHVYILRGGVIYDMTGKPMLNL